MTNHNSPPIKIIFMGTSGWYDTAMGNTISILIETKEYSLVLDAGNGLQKLDRYIDCEKPVYLFLSHFHLDHISGLHILNKFDLKAGLVIFGQEGTGEVLGRFLSPPFTLPLDKLRYSATIAEVPDEIHLLPFAASVLPLLHSSPTIGLRMEIGSRIISYCPDTGYCENAVRLSENADILIAECAYKPGQIDESWPHLNPESAARIASESGAKRLVLVHFDASRYTDGESRRAAEAAASEIFPATTASNDDMIISV
jgi:ribonuclease BN (tRNA processing enzyme)